MKNIPGYFKDSLISSYSQVFFTTHNRLGYILILSSFLGPEVGLSGLICAVATIVMAHYSGFNKTLIRSGAYSYNSLLVGLSLGFYFKFSVAFVALLIISSLITFFLTIWLASVTERFRLPFLSLPFVLAVWLILLNIRTFDIGMIQARTTENSIHFLLSANISEQLPALLKMYFRSMSAILFQNNIMTGILLSIGLLIYSRISFSLSILGFVSGYLFFRMAHSNLPDAEYAYSSFNYIFAAIALGGYMFIPSVASFALAILSAPLTGFMITALLKLTEPHYLPLFSLPFSLSTLLLISVFNKRISFRYLYAVQYQLYSPEKNLYAFHTYMERFKHDTYIHIQLPFFGEWRVSQGHTGSITHKGDWQYAWDFVVNDEDNKTYRLPGTNLSDFYCYGLPVLAPADGTVVTISDDTEDNPIGGVNLQANWGNTIIIKHSDLLYSKLSHIKKGSFKVKAGDIVKKGDVLALCGNSGRSPEPHLHFQQQASAYIGAKTLRYPISYYITKQNNKPVLHSFDYPKEGELIYRPMATQLLQEAFHFVPGKTLEFKVTEKEKTQQEKWEVMTDAWNHTYLYCHTSGATAYFTNNDTVFYFTGFTGSKTSLLYYFYLGAHKILLSYIPDLRIDDRLLIDENYAGPLKFIQDFAAPFYIFMKPAYHASFSEADDIHQPDRLSITSAASAGAVSGKELNFVIDLEHHVIQRITIHHTNRCIIAEYIG